jgi:hypothetical protein
MKGSALGAFRWTEVCNKKIKKNSFLGKGKSGINNYGGGRSGGERSVIGRMNLECVYSGNGKFE